MNALRGIDLEIQRGEFTSIVGPSGSGKTTLLNIIECIDLPTRGKVIIQGEELQSRKSKELALLRRYFFGFIFQSFNLIPVLTVYENVELALNLKSKNLTKKKKEKKVTSILDKVWLLDKREMKPLELSGGEQQRVPINRCP